MKNFDDASLAFACFRHHLTDSMNIVQDMH